MSEKARAHVALIVANVIYGVNYFVVKEVVPAYINPYALSVIRAFGALACLWVLRIWYKPNKVDRADVWKLVVAGILGVTINQTLLIAGLCSTSSINASIIMTTNPLFVLVVAALYLKQRLTLTKFIGIAIGAAGALLVITSNGSLSVSSKTFLGDSLILANAVMYAVYLVWSKPLMDKYDAMTVMGWMFLYGSIFMAIFGCWFMVDVPYAEIPLYIWIAVAFIVFGATFVTYLFNVYGLRFVSPTTVSIYIYLQPIIASILAVFIKNDSFTFVKALAMLFVFAGVYFVGRGND